MHSLILTSDVADYLRVADSFKFQPSINVAHAMVAAEIGVTTLDERKVVDDFSPYSDEKLLIVSDGPIASVESVFIGDEEIDLSTLIVGRWTIKRRNGGLWLSASEVEVSLTAGYRGPDDSAENTPDPIKQALIIQAAQLYQVPDSSLTYEQIGDYSRKREVRTGAGVINIEARLLLRDFKRPPSV